MTQELPQISTPDAILRIKKLIETKQGDPGRLQYISERLHNGKHLFRSDEIYLHNKISASVIPIQLQKPTERDEKIKEIKRLLSIKFGDPGRLRYMLAYLERGRQLYQSDESYLESKIVQLHDFTEGRRLKPRFRKQVPKPEPIEFFEEPQKEKIEESRQPDPDIPEKLQGIEEAVLSPETKNSSDLFDLIEETPKKDVKIQQEREKISKLKHNHEQLKIQHDELSQLIAYRQEYEQKINREKEILEKEIKIEQEKVKEKDLLVAELIKNQSKIIQSKTEREVLLEQIRIDKEKSEKELSKMQQELDELKQQYSDLQSEIKSKKQNLDDQIKEQKEKIDKLKEDSEEP